MDIVLRQMARLLESADEKNYYEELVESAKATANNVTYPKAYHLVQAMTAALVTLQKQ